MPKASAPRVQGVADKARREVGTNVYGNGPSTPLDAAAHTFKVARILMAVGLLFAFCGSAIFFIWGSWGVLADIKCAPPTRGLCGLTSLCMPAACLLGRQHQHLAVNREEIFRRGLLSRL